MFIQAGCALTVFSLRSAHAPIGLAALAKGASAILMPQGEERPRNVSVPVIFDRDPRRRFAQFSAKFFGAQPKCIVAVTGTNGKTSIVAFLRQIWQANGIEAASMGTVGVVTRAMHIDGNMTTPEPVTLHSTLKELKAQRIEHVALEASSHGIIQRRLDGLTIAAAGFSNITRDHLDYHGTFEGYLASKLRLFDTVLDSGAKAVINMDDRHGEIFKAAARINGVDVISVGRKGKTLRLIDVQRRGFAQVIRVEAEDGVHEVSVPLVGEFQVSNALVAAGLAMATGLSAERALHALSGLTGAKGRLELVAQAPNGAPIFVDYAHTPDAIATAAQALRPFVDHKLSIVFGAGGDRDKGKRKPMGEAAAQFADRVYVTDDNPRSENPADIRDSILQGAPDAIEIGDRQEAITCAIADLKPGDVLLVAGKGHEMGQVVAGKTLAFSDHEAVKKALPNTTGTRAEPLWTLDELLSATQGRLMGQSRATVNGLSIDSRAVKPGDLFIALKGEQTDGHAYVETAMGRGAALSIVAEDRLSVVPEKARPLLVVDDVQQALNGIARVARSRSNAKIIAITGSVGKTSAKDALRAALTPSGRTHSAAASFNNHLGVPLTLGLMPRDCQFGVFEIGMNHPGEIRSLVDLVRPHIAIITTIAAAHLEHMGTVEAIARAKAEIFEGVMAGGTVVLNRDNAWFGLLSEIAGQFDVRIVSFGEHAEAGARLQRCVLKEDCSAVTADILGELITYKISVPGRHLVDNSLAVLAAVKIAGGDLALAGLELGRIRQPKGRGLRHRLHVSSGTVTLVDESYNANPTSMRAALAMLGHATAARRRVVVLGDMLELGPNSAQEHQGLLQAILDAHVNRVYCSGPMMKSLWNVLPNHIRAAYCDHAEGLRAMIEDDLRAGDIVMIKGSNGSRMVPLVDHLVARFGSGDDSGYGY